MGFSVRALSRMGVTEDQFVVGTQVRLAGRVSTLVPNRFLLTNMLRPDGTEVVLTTDGDSFWNGQQIGGRSQWRNEEISTAAEEDRGLFRVWSTARMGQARDNRIMLTERALAARKSFDQSRSFVVTCEPQGMPTVMNWVYPFELSQPDPNTIILRSEYFDLERTIHLWAPATVPEGLSASRLGYSIGRWEDNGRSLVVETTGRPARSRHDRYAAHARCRDHRAVYLERRSVGPDVYRRSPMRRHSRAGDRYVGEPRARGDHRAFRLRTGLACADSRGSVARGRTWS